MYWKLLFCAFAGLSLIAVAGHTAFIRINRAETVSPQRRNQAQGQNYSVNVTGVTERTTTQDTIVYQVSYNYEFRNRNNIYVEGLGIVPAKGRFNYMASEPRLVFRESATGEVVSIVELEETYRTQQANSTEFPEDGKFPSFYRSNTWNHAEKFPEAAARVIQKYFLSGYNARQSGQVNQYITTYRNLEISNPNNDSEIQNLRSQIAISLSQPYDPLQNRFTYHIQFVARDRPRFSSTWRYGDDRKAVTISAAQTFIDKLIAELGNN